MEYNTSGIDYMVDDERAFKMHRAVGRVAYRKIEAAYAIREPEENWRDRALCLQVDTDMFFPEKGGSPEDAKKVCAACPVKVPCLQFALDTDAKGVWAATTEHERRGMSKSVTETLAE